MNKHTTDLTPLDRFTLDKISASIILDTRRAKASGYFPVKYRITFMRRQVYYPCMDLTIDEFDKLHGIVRSETLQKTKNLILAGFKRITDTIEDIFKNDDFTIEKLNRRLSRGVKDSILTAFDNRIEDLKAKGKVGSAVWYSCAVTNIRAYTDKDLKFSDITPEWLRGYEAHLLEEERTYTTVSMYMRAVRAIINTGLNAGIIKQAQYPFVIKNNGRYKIPEGTGTKRALTESQLMKLLSYPLLPADEIYRELWYFSYLCNGANMNDILRFKFKDIVSGGIEFYRGKTVGQDRQKRKIRAVVTDEMQEIIDKYGNQDTAPKNYIFPYLSPGLSPEDQRKVIQNVTHSINKKMKRIGQALGFGDVTTYWARHTWASLSRSKGVKLFAISKGLGHKNLTTTQSYLDSLPDEELIDNAALIPTRKKFNNESNRQPAPVKRKFQRQVQ